MNRNTPTFDKNMTSISLSRSKKNLSHSYKGTFNAGYLYPIWSYCDVLPGDTFKLNLASLIRMSTPSVPVMDDVYCDVYAFFTPHKVSLERFTFPSNSTSYSWKAFIGAQDYFVNAPLPASTDLPVLYDSAAGSLPLGSFLERIGVRPGIQSSDVTTIHGLDFLAYVNVWDEFFRDENTMNPVAYDIDAYGKLQFYGGPASWNGDEYADIFSADILPVSRPHGYFGSALPWPQRSAAGVTIPLVGTADIESDGVLTLIGSVGGQPGWFNLNAGASELVSPSSYTTAYLTNNSTGQANYGSMSYRSGLKVDLSDVSAVTINQLRALIAKQHFYESLARGGNRLGEISAATFGVYPHDAGEEHAEYLGGKRIPIVMSEIAQTAPTTSGTAGIGIGNLGAFSKTVDQSYIFEKSFDTWGTLQVFVAFRTRESFNQGLPRRLSRKTRDDFYWPAFAKIGEQPILNKEIFYQDKVADNEVFGYQVAWAEYMYEPDYVSGYLRPGSSLGYFTFTNQFSTLPSLAGYLAGGDGIKANVDRVLQVKSSTSGYQFIGDFYFDCTAIRTMPSDMRPGLTRI